MPRDGASSASGSERAGTRAQGTDWRATTSSSRIDARVQRAAEAALGGPAAAVVVAIDPNNGDVIAFVSTPTFDPNGFARGLTVPEYAALQDDIDKPLYDRALRGVYPPGSTIKPLIALAALEYGVADPEETRVTARACFQLPGSSHRYRDWKKGGHGTVNMHRAIAAVLRRLFLRTSRTRSASTACTTSWSRFGLGSQTGIDIARRAHGPRAVAGVEEARRSSSRSCRSGSRARP